MRFLSKIFGKSDNQIKKKDKVKLSHDSGVPYNNDLISVLKKDHIQLKQEFEKIIKSYKNKNFKILKKNIKTFKTTFEIHNYSEKIQLYLYLKNYYKDMNEESFINNMADSAEKLYQDSMYFLKKYESIEFNNQYLEVFEKDLESIKKILKSRIDIEESELYQLYKK